MAHVPFYRDSINGRAAMIRALAEEVSSMSREVSVYQTMTMAEVDLHGALRALKSSTESLQAALDKIQRERGEAA